MSHFLIEKNYPDLTLLKVEFTCGKLLLAKCKNDLNPYSTQLPLINLYPSMI